MIRLSTRIPVSWLQGFGYLLFFLRFAHSASEALLRSASMLNVSAVMMSDKTRLAVGTQLHLECGKCSRGLSLPQQSYTSHVFNPVYVY